MTAQQPGVSLSNVSDYFGGGELRRQILFDVTADVLPGEMVMGPSGSAKATVLNPTGALCTGACASWGCVGRFVTGDPVLRVAAPCFESLPGLFTELRLHQLAAHPSVTSVTPLYLAGLPWKNPVTRVNRMILSWVRRLGEACSSSPGPTS